MSNEGAERGKFSIYDIVLLLLPLFYPASLLFTLSIKNLKQIPGLPRLLLYLYSFSQLIPAVFSPDPIPSILGALFRLTLVLGLIAAGMFHKEIIKRSIALYFSLGLSFSLLIAVIYNIVQKRDFWSQRLSHPYMTENSVGIAGCFCIWIALLAFKDSTGNKNYSYIYFRIWLFSIGILAIVGSGSRVALICLVTGLLSTYLIRESGTTIKLAISISVILLVPLVYIGQIFGIESFRRLTIFETSGREFIWHATKIVIDSHPIFGIGPYMLGKYVDVSNSCYAWNEPCNHSIAQIIDYVGKPWIIAHNSMLHQLAETGPLGLSGFLLLSIYVLRCAIKQKDSLILAIVSGITIGNLSDNLTIVPSPFFAEIYYLSAGYCIRRGNNEFNLCGPDLREIASLSLLVILITLAPLYAAFLPIKASHNVAIRLVFYNNDRELFSDPAKNITMQFSGLSGTYEAVVMGCSINCLPISKKRFSIKIDENLSDIISLELGNTSEYSKIEMKLFSANGIIGSSNPVSKFIIGERQK